MNRFCFALMAVMALFGQTMKAQMVTIPDPNFLFVLQSSDAVNCLNGNQLDASCPEVLNTTELVCTGLNIQDLTGIEAFVNLEILHCNNNDLTFLPALPSSLTYLACNNNAIVSLPALPDSLTYLDCTLNQLTTLPTLPTSLTEMWCSYNQLQSLPNLSATALVNFQCDHNQLTVLPTLPTNLIAFGCGMNEITNLPLLPDSLKYLDCLYNQLTALPELPPSLNSLNCNNNQISVLSNLPATLKVLYCFSNQLTSVHDLPSVLTVLKVNNNPDLLCLPPFDEFNGSNVSFNISNTGITCLPNVIQHTGYIAAIDTLPICNLLGNSCDVAWNIAGNIYRDDNNNCMTDSAESDIQNIKFELLQGGNVQQQVYSNGAGNFSFDTNLGIYTTRVDTSGLPFNVTCPANNLHASTLIANDSLDYDADFALQCKPGYDLAVQSVCRTSGIFFPAQQAVVSIQAGDLVKFYGFNCNTAGLTGTVTATYTGLVNVASVSGNGLVAGNTIIWNVSDFSQLDFFNDFWISFLTDTFAQAGEQVCLNVSIAANTGTDNNASNNNFVQCFSVVNSYDPNIKEVYPSSVSQPGDWHTYTVHFQNTGTAAAQHIQVIDTLDANLDWSSFQLLAYSHDNLTQVKQNGIVHFNFPNIQLPDSTSDEPNSHGWIQYKIKTDSTITPGTTIHNTASIYFDFNAPVVTNDATVSYCVSQNIAQNFQICSGDSVNVGNDWYHQGGVYTNAFTTANGCDSIVTTTLAVLVPSLFEQTFVVCAGDSIVVGNTIYETLGTYTDIFQNAFGCDSVVTTTLEWFPLVNVDVTVNDSVLTAANGGVAYQWFNCIDGLPIDGATSQTFVATKNGSYWVQVTDSNGCVRASQCVTATVTRLESLSQNRLTLYPNPAQNTLIVECSNWNNRTLLQLTDLTGKIIFTVAFKDSQTTLALDEIGSGSYIVQLTENGKILGVKNLTVIK